MIEEAKKITIKYDQRCWALSLLLVLHHQALIIKIKTLDAFL
jgi:hypothetical protein